MNATALYVLLVALMAVANLPCLLYVLKHRRKPMPMLPQFQAAFDELNASISAVGQQVSDLKNQVANAPAAQDVADTVAAFQASADTLKGVVGQ